MQCWNRLNLHYKDVLKIPRGHLNKYLMDNTLYNTNESYVLFYAFYRNIFNEDFIKLIESRGLSFMSFCVGFSLIEHAKGFVHVDYYGGVTSEVNMKNYRGNLDDIIVPSSYVHQDLIENTDLDQCCKVSLHLNIGASGSLVWYNGDTVGKFEKTTLEVPVYRYYEEEKLIPIDSMDHNGISICRTNVPHCSDNRDKIYKNRMIMTVRFNGNPEFEEVKEKLGDLVIERE